MFDPTSILTAGVGLLASGTGYIIKKVNDNDKQMAAHMASDLATFQALATSLNDLKVMQRDQTMKLDRLVENLPKGK